MHHHHRMYYGISRDELLSLAGDRKRMKFKDIRDKKKDVNAPPADRIPLPSLSENIKIERRMAYRDALTKKGKISFENPPSICLYTVLNGNNGLCSASISENCGMLALGLHNSAIRVNAMASEELRELKSGEELEETQKENEDDVHEGVIFKEGSEKTKSIELLGHHGPVYSVSFSPERRLLLSGSRDCTVCLWNLEMRRNLVIYRTVLPVWQALFCNRGYYFATATADQTVGLWATDRVQPIRLFTKADSHCIDFHPNCNYIVGGTEDQTVKVWDILTGNCVRTFTDCRGPVKSVKVSPCGRYIVSASEEGQIAIFDLAQNRLLGTQECDPIDYNVPIVFSRDASTFAMGTPNYGVTFFSMDVMTSTAGSNYHHTSQDPMSKVKTDPHGFALFSYPTRRTSILDFHFTRRNTVVAVGVFNQ